MLAAVSGRTLAFTEELEDMDVSMAAQPKARPCVRVILTPAQAKDVAHAIRNELVTECGGTLAAPLPTPDDIARLRTIIDVYAQQLEALDWGEPSAAIEIECPTDLLETIAQEVREDGEERVKDDDVAVCAVVAHLLTPVA
jgi:hypothetical protein